MNDVPIPLVHGFPLRAIVPGWEGAYAVKWLSSLRVIDREFDGFWVATGYRYPTKRVKPGAPVAAIDMAPLTGLVIKSLITQPLDGATVPPGKIPVAGFAWAGEDDVERVEVSADNGATWERAELVGERAPYAWRRFEATLHATKAESYLIMSRATDSEGRTQPDVAHWNPSGYLWNAPDRVRIEVALTDVGTTDPVPAPVASHEAPGTTEGEPVFQRACLSCHGRDLVEQQHLTQGGWTREVDKMIRWGAQVPDADKESLVRFLSASHGPIARIPF